MLLVYIRYTFFGLSLLASALIAGFFYAYSVSVMRGLAASDPLSAIHAMQGINAVIRTPAFAFSFFGALAFPLAAALVAQRRSAMMLALSSAIIYGLGGIAVTFTVNVPLNSALVVASPTASNAAELWQSYTDPWITWNHVRTLASMVSFACITWAFVVECQCSS